MTLQTILTNFALILFVLMVLTGIVWFLDIFYFAKQRRALADKALAAFDERNAKLVADGVKVDYTTRASVEAAIMRQPTWIEYSGSFFPVIALVFFLRSFLYEPFKIPSTSMVPTLLVGDLILVNRKVIDVNDPQRGDVMVFKYPKDMSQDYIKRVVGVPGDKISYENKRLTINGKAVSYTALDDYLDDVELAYHKQYVENLTSVPHKILNREGRATVNVAGVENFPNRAACDFSEDKFTCIVPEGNYFMMGDNRDNSQDSRYWGFVPNKNIVGKAFFVWMNLGNLDRIGSIN